MMGHSTLEMLFKRYGRSRFRLVDDRESIIEFFWVDYLRLGNASVINLFAKAAKDEYRRPREDKIKAA